MPYVWWLMAWLLITVSPLWAATARISWQPPTTNEDGSPLTDLAGYRVYIGTVSGVYGQPFDVGLATSMSQSDYVAGQTYFWVVTAYDTSGNESVYSVEVSKTIALPPPGETDTIPPVVAISSPAPGGTVPRKGLVTITATASDNVGVISVEFYVNGQRQCPPDQSAPYACTWNVPAAGGNRRYTLHATARDASNNVGTSPIVEVIAQ
jgi:hypothetical protein